VTDAELLVASRHDAAAFRELYDRWAERLLAWFYRRVFDPEVAADLLAETFAVAYERRHRFRDLGRPGSAWLFGIAQKELAHWARHRAAEQRAVRRLGIVRPALDDESIARIEALTDLAAPAAGPGRGPWPNDRPGARRRAAQGPGGARLPDDRGPAGLQRGHGQGTRPPRPDPPGPPAGGGTVSTIPFVQRLGDAIEVAITDPAAARRRLLRRLVLSVAVLALLGGSLAAARLLNEPERLATAGIGCYQDAAMRGPVSIVWPGRRSPVEACAETWRAAGQPVPPLVACAYHGAVAVLPGRDEAACQRQALEPLPPGYAPALGKVAELERAILAIEGQADCLPPPVLAARVQRLLDRSGWTGWTTWLRPDVAAGPCGSVSDLGGGGRRSIAGALDEAGHRVMVFGGPPRSTDNLLYGPGRLAPTLQDASGERCYRPDHLAEQVRRRVAAAAPGRSVTITQRVDRTLELGDARGPRLDQGCAVVVGVGPAGNGHDLVVEVVRRR
jgi:Sigma-70 region 2